MIKRFIPLKNEVVTRPTYSEFVASLTETGIPMEVLGQSYDGQNIYGMKIGEFTTKPVLVVVGSMHGSEWQAGLYVKQFMEIINRGTYPGATRDIQRIKSKFDFYFIPFVNPYGLDNNTRQNANNVDINRNFDYKWEEYDDTDFPTRKKGSAPFSESETKVIRDVCLQYKPISLLDCHSNSGKSTLQRPRVPRKYVVFQENINDSIQLSAPSESWGEILRPAENPMSAYWYDNQIPRNGMRSFSAWIEPSYAISDSVCIYTGLNLLWGCILNLEKYFSSRVLV